MSFVTALRSYKVPHSEPIEYATSGKVVSANPDWEDQSLDGEEFYYKKERDHRKGKKIGKTGVHSSNTLRTYANDTKDSQYMTIHELDPETKELRHTRTVNVNKNKMWEEKAELAEQPNTLLFEEELMRWGGYRKQNDNPKNQAANFNTSLSAKYQLKMEADEKRNNPTADEPEPPKGRSAKKKLEKEKQLREEAAARFANEEEPEQVVYAYTTGNKKKDHIQLRYMNNKSWEKSKTAKKAYLKDAALNL